MTTESGTTHIVCPKCGGPTIVSDSRASGEQCIRRRRACVEAVCRHRFSTYEIVVESGLDVSLALNVVGELGERFLAAVTLVRRATDALSLLNELGKKEGQGGWPRTPR